MISSNENNGPRQNKVDILRKSVQHGGSKSNSFITANFKYIMSFFTIHGCCKWSFGSLEESANSIFTFLIDVWLLYVGVIPWYAIGNFNELAAKKELTETGMLFIVLGFRFWLHKNGCHLMDVARKVQRLKLLTSATRGLPPDSSRKLLLILTVNSLFYLLLIPLNVWVTQLDASETEHYLHHFYYHGNATDTKFLIITFLHTGLHWFVTAIPSIFVIYFYLVCQKIKEAFDCYTTILRRNEPFSDSTVDMYNVIFDTFMKIRHTLHSPILIVCTQILAESFYHLFITVFNLHSIAEELPLSMILLLSCLVNFSVLCSSASTVRKAHDTMRRALHSLLIERNDPEMFLLTITLNKKTPLCFFILDSIELDNSLVLYGSGTLLTYGIMIVTFGHTTHRFESIEEP